MYIVGKYIYNIYKSRILLNFFAGALEKTRKRGSSLFHSECNLIIYLSTMYEYCVYPEISKKSKTPAKLKII